MNKFDEILNIEYLNKIKRTIFKYKFSWVVEILFVVLLFIGIVVNIPYRPYFNNYFISDFAFFAIMLIFSGILFSIFFGFHRVFFSKGFLFSGSTHELEDKLSLIDVSNLNKKNKEKFLSVKRNLKRLKTREYRMLVRPYNALFLILESSLIFILNVFYFKTLYPTYMSQQKVLFFVFKLKLFFFVLIVAFIVFGIIFLLYKVKTNME